MRTHPLGPSILPGITRHVLLDLASTFDTGVGEAHKHRRTRCTQQKRSLPGRPSSSFPWSALAAGRLEMGGQARWPSCCKHPTSSAHAILATGQHFGTASARTTGSARRRHIADAASRRPREGICVSEQPASNLRSIQLQPIIYFVARTKGSTSLVRAFAASSGGSFSVTT